MRSDLFYTDDPCQPLNFCKTNVCCIQHINVSIAQIVLRAPFFKLFRTVHDHHTALHLRGFIFPHEQDRRRNPGTVEKVRRKADDTLNQIILNKCLADDTFSPCAKQHTMWHNHCQPTVFVEAGEHVLNKCKVTVGRGGVP